jgi:REP element-mobilizing transposase RayT
MARQLRIEYPGALYHVMSRGNEAKEIFTEDSHYLKFLKYIENTYRKFDIILHAFCLMKNHYHLLIETKKANLCRCMHYLNSCYSIYYSYLNKKNGHVFQGRYKAILVEKDSYLKTLSRYIHLNPIRAKLVEHPKDYPWTSYRYFILNEKPPSYLEAKFTLSSYFKDKQHYGEYVEEGLKKKLSNPLSEAAYGIILGTDKFVKKIKKKYLNESETDSSVTGLSRLAEIDILPDDILSVIEDDRHIAEKEIKKLKVYFLHKYTGYTMKEISSKALGKRMTAGGVSQIVSRLEKRAQKDEALKRTMERLETKMLNVKL